MTVQMTVTKIETDEDSAEVKHARQVDHLRMQCNICKLNKPNTPTKDCAIRHKLVIEDSPIGWKHRHLFLENGKCKAYKEK